MGHTKEALLIELKRYGEVAWSSGYVFELVDIMVRGSSPRNIQRLLILILGKGQIAPSPSTD